MNSMLSLILILSVVAFTFFSSVGIVFLASDKLRVRKNKKNFRLHVFVLDLFSVRKNDFFSTVMIGSNLALVSYAIAFFLFFNHFFNNLLEQTIIGEVLVVAEVIISTILFILLVELSKTAFRLNFNFLSKTLALPLSICYLLFYPMVLLCAFFARCFSFLVAKPLNKLRDDNQIDAEEFFYLSEDINEKLSDVEYEKEIKIFQNALDFSEVRLHECMVPRNEIYSIEETSSLEELQVLFVKSGYSRILVYQETRDNMIGYVSSKDLFKDYADIRSMLRPIDFVPETMPAQKQLAAFIKNKKSIAIVVDEFGGTVGLVTLEDVMEEIFGDIEDEHDSDNLIEKQLSENEFLFSGRLEVDYLNEQYDLAIPEKDEYETLAGYILYKYERLPDAGEELLMDNFIVRVVKLSATRIELVKMKVLS